MEDARREKATEEHSVIDDAIQDRGEGYTVFSIVSPFPGLDHVRRANLSIIARRCTLSPRPEEAGGLENPRLPRESGTITMLFVGIYAHLN